MLECAAELKVLNMSRLKKSRSLKRVTGGVKTGSKERTKLENKQRKAKKKAANPRKSNRQRSVYQQFLDDNNGVEPQHAQQAPAAAIISKPAKAAPAAKAPIAKTLSEKPKALKTETIESSEPSAASTDEDLWAQLENPTNNDTF